MNLINPILDENHKNKNENISKNSQKYYEGRKIRNDGTIVEFNIYPVLN